MDNVVMKMREAWLLLNDNQQPIIVNGGESIGVLIFSSETMAKVYAASRRSKSSILKVSIPDLIDMMSASAEALITEDVKWMMIDNMGTNGAVKHIPISAIACLPRHTQTIRLSFTRVSHQ